MTKPSTTLAGAMAAVLVSLYAGTASTGHYVMVHPGTDCTASPHIAQGMYGSRHQDHPHIGYWNEHDSYGSGSRYVFCPIGMITGLRLREYDWDENTRVSLESLQSLNTDYDGSQIVRLHVYLIRNNPGYRRHYCWVSVTYHMLSGNHHFDWDSTPVVYADIGFNRLEFNLTDLYSPDGYATLVCNTAALWEGLPSQIAGYTLLVFE